MLHVYIAAYILLLRFLNWILFFFLDLWAVSICLCILLDFFAIYLAKCTSANSSTKLTMMNLFDLYTQKVCNEWNQHLFVFFPTNYFKRWIAKKKSKHPSYLIAYVYFWNSSLNQFLYLNVHVNVLVSLIT